MSMLLSSEPVVFFRLYVHLLNFFGYVLHYDVYIFGFADRRGGRCGGLVHRYIFYDVGL
jgi:hypothetical protein